MYESEHVMAERGSSLFNSGKGWTSTQAYSFAIVCLVVAGAAGYFLRGSISAGDSKAALAAGTKTSAALHQQRIMPQQMKHMAEKQAEPLIARLRTTPKDPTLLSEVGNIYFDTQQYKEAIGYYERALKVDPKNVDVRADMATCYWYVGNADEAIANYEQGLALKPDHANILFNLGVVKWEGKLDPDGALKAWERLLRTNPNFQNKAQVQELIARARQHVDTGAVGRMPNN
jgi:tetratricopeptide (TPR) repeat protein